MNKEGKEKPNKQVIQINRVEEVGTCNDKQI